MAQVPFEKPLLDFVQSINVTSDRNDCTKFLHLLFAKCRDISCKSLSSRIASKIVFQQICEALVFNIGDPAFSWPERLIHQCGIWKSQRISSVQAVWNMPLWSVGVQKVDEQDIGFCLFGC